MSKQTKVAEAKTGPIKNLPKACADESLAVEFVEAQRWGGEPACPRCGNMDVYKMTDRKTGQRNSRYLWRCRGCNSQYTVRIGTIFEDSPIPLMHWCYAFWQACSSKKGVSAKQIQRQTGLSYKSALFMMHRIRFTMAGDSAAPLSGVVEADETFCGGKPRNHGERFTKGKSGRGSDKVPVIAVLQRGADVRATPVERLDSAALREFIMANVDVDSVLMTDESVPYRKIGKEFSGHEKVKHSAREYVRGNAHINGIESFFAIIKRSLYGIHHAVSRKHLHRYVGERAFVFNARHVDDGERTVMALKRTEGKRLRYSTYVQ